MSPRSFVAVVTALLLLAGVAPAAALVGAPTNPSGGGAVADAAALPHNSSLDPGDWEMRIDMAANGDAQWRVKTVVPVEDGDRQAFADLVERFNESEDPLGLDTFRMAATNASEATGRSMEIRNVQRHHARHNETGALWITFTWTNFGRTSGDRLAVGDVFNASSSNPLPELKVGETLVIVPPDGYGVTSAPTGGSSAPSSLSNGVARWSGPQDFVDRGPWIVYSGDAPTATLTPTTAPRNGTVTPTGDGPGTSPGGPGGDGLLQGALPMVVLIVLAAASAAVLAAYMRGDDDGFDGLGAIVGSGGEDGGSSATADSDGAPDPDTGVEVDASSGSTAAAENGSGAGNAASAGGSAAGASATSTSEAADGADDSADEEIDEELLSDEERVERLIEHNGGRMKQAAIVQETGWSNAKVSQLLSAMDDDGRIDKLRIGRENLISFPDEDVADLDSE
ncbi:helix-turn-helix transcriptional regulator [Halosimplex sp. TS25]|uniref:helix-turn-helix transcriptional regulator n=1 Tax=Halosimplex rarum TaxID=3396619 RepID=UPI0039ED3F77